MALRQRRTVLLCVGVLLACTALTLAVDRSKFRTCKDAAFCRRHRDKTEFAGKFYVVPNSVTPSDSTLVAELSGGEAGAPPFTLDMRFYRTGTARIRVTEKTTQEPRWETPDVVIESQLVPAAVTVHKTAPGVIPAGAGESAYVSYTSATGSDVVVVLQYQPFKVLQYVDNELLMSVNSRGLFHFEHRRTRAGNAVGHSDEAAAADPNAGKKIVDWGEDGRPIYEDGSVGGDDPNAVPDKPEAGGDDSDESGMWEESFGSHRDSKPNGPTSISLDISFHGSQHVYGIPEHATSLSLKTTDNSAGGYNEPYRLYNLDVFEYEMDEPMALYGAIPFMWSHTAKKTCGAFLHNPTEMYIDISKDSTGTHTRWIAESGIVDLMLLPGPRPKQVFGQYATLTGSQAMPPMFAIAYHQCRWNYKDENDVFTVDSKFEEHNFPYDVLWLDIEHTDGKRYFTWDKANFPDPIAMQNKLAERGRKMVTIIDPHIKRDSNYHIHHNAQTRDLYIKNKDGGEFDGWCWPGSSSYLDFTEPKVRDWWADQFALDTYIGSTKNLYTWNDMNEPSVFNGPEVSMNKDAKSLAGVEHREWHNMYGFYHQWATAEGLQRRNQARPFVLTRSFYAGSQRFGAIWTGDNAAEWSHLAASAPMLMTINLAGLSFAGADVGGFFGNPDTELLERWYQAGAFQPFLRAHAHIDTKRREPWLFGPEVLGRVRASVIRRYTYLPLWYTLFYEAYSTGVATMRPLFVEFPEDEKTFAMEDQWMVGSDLLVKPVTAAGITSVSVYLPGSEPWYDVETSRKFAPGTHSVAAPLDKIPVFQRGGSIVPRKMRLRRCSSLMKRDPYTLEVALDSSQTASGRLYVDDEESFAYKDGAYRLRQFTFKDRQLSSTQVDGSPTFEVPNTVERVIVIGYGASPSKVTAKSPAGAEELTFVYDAAADRLVVRKPNVRVDQDWTISFE